MSSSRKIVATFLPALALGCVLSIGSSAQTANSQSASSSKATASHLSASDRTFMKEAAEGGQAEVELGQLAQQKAQSQDVKDFGQRMVTDHSKANDELKEVASKEGITLPTEPSSKDRAEKARLEKMSGTQFDKAYMNYMLADHKKDVASFKKEATSGHDPDVKNFAKSTLPTLESHLKNAEQVAPKQTSSNTTSTTASASKR